MPLTQEWATEARHPSPTALFALPNAIYFLLKFRLDLAAFEHQSIEGRVTLYFWWKAYGKRDYPDFEWVLRDADIEYVAQLDAQTLIERFPRAISFWLAGTTPDILNETQMLDALVKGDLAIEPTRAQLPRFLSLLVSSRADLRAHIDLSLFSGQLGALSWWEMHGQFEYPRITWSPNSVWDNLNELGSAENDESIGIPAFLNLLVTSRPDLRASLDMTTFSGSFGALVWWAEHGKFEYPRLIWRTSTAIQHLNELVHDEGGALISIPHFLTPLVDSRPDLKCNIDLNSATGRFSILLWWDGHGRREYPRLEWATAETFTWLNQLDDGDERGLFAAPNFLPLLLQSRPDLQALFDLDTFRGRLNAMQWWMGPGRQEYRRLDWQTTGILDRLNRLDDGDRRGTFRVPEFLPRLVQSRADLQSLFDLDTFRGRLNAMQWWMGAGQQEYSSLKWKLHESLSDLLHTEVLPNVAMPLPRLLLQLRESRPDLVSAFDIGTERGALTFIEWWHTTGRNEYSEFRHLRVVPSALMERAITKIRNEPATIEAHPFGVNIVGFPQGVLGLGEDARMAAYAMQHAGFDIALINAPMSGPPRIDTSVNHLLCNDLVYQVSVFCLPPPEMVRLALEGGRRMIDAPTHKIGAWPWELPHWPSAFGKIYEIVDEIWAQSKFVQSVYSRLGDTPVHHMPMTVDVPQPVDPRRERFGLPSNEFLFYLMFDNNSWLSRKNPLAGVQAFKQAFGEHSPGVGLVIKAMNVRDDDPVWRAVRELATGDSRIHIVSERLSRQDSIDFMACCDAYISLHRSEGFGRVIAEAMALGQPVVATNFSGNVDFCDPDTAFLVDGELVPLRAGDYLFSESQYWCDPDVSIAAEQLKRMIEDAPLRERIAQAGKARIVRDYSIEAVSRAYKRCLTAIAEARAK
ncbi:MAG: FIG00455500: hypothetical protein [uncultured Paraburkholderia sp.]|nr:MAG: FIG00455500: hypothetical protein [uncultured Paraburkholderia sp.]CAH2926780.1 MAG: FIG00455500: hypothetical protein [uncultured Paraburkholderia sp.]